MGRRKGRDQTRFSHSAALDSNINIVRYVAVEGQYANSRLENDVVTQVERRDRQE